LCATIERLSAEEFRQSAEFEREFRALAEDELKAISRPAIP